MPDTNIAHLTGPELIDRLNALSLKQSQYSKLKIKATEELKPIEQARASKRLEIAVINEEQRQIRLEIAAIKYAIHAEGN